MKIGDYDISVCVVDRLWLDGGAMFGAIPKTLWSKRTPVDEKNRIQLACRLLVIKSNNRTILVDSGTGTKWSDKEREIYAIKHVSEESLHSRIPNVTDLVLTHLHFDHAGGVSYRTNDGLTELSYPGALHYINKTHLEHARNAGVREQASYLAENIIPLGAAKLRLTNDGEEIFPGITVHQADGHTRGLQWLLIESGQQKLAYPSDLIPTAQHVPVPYVMGYDLWAEKSMTEKESFLKRAVSEQWVVVYEHDPEIAASYITVDDRGRFAAGKSVEISNWNG